MKRILLFLVPVMITGMISCKKTDNPATPNNPAQGPTPYTPAPGNVAGAFVAVQMKYTYNMEGLPIPVDIESEIGTGGVYTSVGATTFVDAGAISVNGNSLDKQSNNSYLKAAFPGQTPDDLGFDSGADWNIGGAGSVAAFSYSHSGGFPSFTGTMPTEITKASGLTISMSSLSNADSVYILIAAGGTSIFKGYDGSVSSITLSAADLAGLPVVTDRTAYLEVLPVRIKVQTIGGKDYAFVKERAVVAGVNIN
jgi:hypothetical protein